nr:hypothetical protein [Tanacetum cinerariifolium]
DFIALIENQLNKKVKAIRCDNGTEFRNAKLIDLCGERELKGAIVMPELHNKMRVSITNPHNKTPYELLSRRVPNISHLKPFGCQVTILNTSDHLGKFKGKANEGFLVGYAANSKAYRVYNLSSKKVEETLNLRYLEDKPNVQGLGTQDTNINAGTQDDDSESEGDEQAILAPSFPSNSFSDPKVNEVFATMENHLDYAEELAGLQRQEHEAHSAAEKYGIEFSNETAEMLHQAEIETRRNLVFAAGDPAGSIVSTGGVPAGSVPVGSIPTSSVPASNVPTSSVPASNDPASSVPAGGVLAGSADSAGFGDPAASESVLAVFNLDLADNSTLPHGHSLGSSEHSTRFPSPSDLGNHQPKAGIFSSSSYDDDFCADVTNLASSVAVDHVVTKRVNTIHPQSQILGELQSLVQTRSKVQKSKFGESAFISYNQDKYVKGMLKKFDMESVRTATTPYEVPKPKSKDKPDDAVNVHLYRFIIGSLMYLTASRPDIMFAVSACYRHQLEAYSDSDYAGSHGDRKSTTGGCQFLSRRLISWQCKKQTIMASSSTEAEYVAAANCCGQSTICIVKNPAFHQRTKHIEIRHHFIRGANEKNLIHVLKIHTDENVADLLTKAFEGPIFHYLVVHIGMLTLGTRIEGRNKPKGRLTIAFNAAGSTCVPAGVPAGSYAGPAGYDDHNKVAYLEKGKGWEAYEQILDFINRSHIWFISTVEDTISAGAGIPANAQTIPAGSTPIPTTGGVFAGSSMDPTGQATAAAPSSSAISVADKGKAPMVDDSIPTDLLTEQERAKAKSVASPAAQDWLELMAKIATNSALSKQLLGDDVDEDNMNERLGMLLMRKRRELAKQSRVPASIPAAPSIAVDVSISAVSATTADVSLAPTLPAESVAEVHANESRLDENQIASEQVSTESQEDSTTVAFTSRVSHATPSSSRRRRKQIAKKRVTPIVDVVDDALIKFDSASESDDDPSPYAPYTG